MKLEDKLQIDDNKEYKNVLLVRSLKRIFNVIGRDILDNQLSYAWLFNAVYAYSRVYVNAMDGDVNGVMASAFGAAGLSFNAGLWRQEKYKKFTNIFFQNRNKRK